MSTRFVGCSWLIQLPPPSYKQHVSCSFCPRLELTATAIWIFPGNPLQVISNGNSHAFHPLSLHSWIRGWYYKSFCHGPFLNPALMVTVNSIRKILLPLTYNNTTSGQRVVWTIYRNYSLLPSSTLISQEQAVCIWSALSSWLRMAWIPPLWSWWPSLQQCQLASSFKSPALVCQQGTGAPYCGSTYIVLGLESFYSMCESPLLTSELAVILVIAILCLGRSRFVHSPWDLCSTALDNRLSPNRPIPQSGSCLTW